MSYAIMWLKCTRLTVCWKLISAGWYCRAQNDSSQDVHGRQVIQVRTIGGARKCYHAFHLNAMSPAGLQLQFFI